MKRDHLNFDGIMCAVTILFTALGGEICACIRPDKPTGLIVWSMLFYTVPLLLGVCGILATEKWRDRYYVIHRRGKRWHSFAAALGVGIILGGAGQLLYGFTIETTEEVIDGGPIEQGASDIVLLMDYSGSMRNGTMDRTDSAEKAAIMLVEGLEEECRLQVIPFAGRAFEEGTQLRSMDEEGKKDTIDFLSNIDHEGGTDFDAALWAAYSALTLNGNSASGTAGANPNQVVILMTDGQDSVGSAVRSNYLAQDCDIRLYSVRFVSDDSRSSKDRELISLVERTGGFDTEIKVNADGNISIDELLEALQTVIEGEVETREVERYTWGMQNLTYGSESLNIYRRILRVLVFFLYGVAVTWVYYYRITFKGILFNLAAAVALMLLVPTMSAYGASWLFVLVFWTAYTRYYPAEGGRNDV